MRVVIDPNVFISGIFWGGPPSDILSLWQKKKITLCLSPEILQEYQRVAEHLSNKYPSIDISRIIELVTIHGQVFPNQTLEQPICRDPDDDKFIACALVANAQYLISGDKDLLDITQPLKTQIIKPREFLENFKPCDVVPA